MLLLLLYMDDKDSKTDQSNSSNDEGSASEDESATAAEPLATTRSRRANAGNRMSKMIQDEEDEFYKNLYGGFDEEEDDIDFDDEDDADEDEVEDDYDVDSDFSIDETDEIAPEHQAVDEEVKRKSRAYRDPKPKGYSIAPASGPSESGPTQPRTKPSSATPQTPSKRAERSFRDSTRKKTEETIKNIQTGKKRKKKFRKSQDLTPLTQEEMLAEAKLTEEENIRSLEIYQRLESEKLKKIKQVKKTLPPPFISYQSFSMPLIDPKTNCRTSSYSRNFIVCTQCDLFPKESPNKD